MIADGMTERERENVCVGVWGLVDKHCFGSVVGGWAEALAFCVLGAWGMVISLLGEETGMGRWSGQPNGAEIQAMDRERGGTY